MKQLCKEEQIRIVKRYYVERIHARQLSRLEGISNNDLGTWIHKHLEAVKREHKESRQF